MQLYLYYLHGPILIFVLTPSLVHWPEVRFYTLKKISSFMTCLCKKIHLFFTLKWFTEINFFRNIVQWTQFFTQILSDPLLSSWVPLLKHAFASKSSHLRLLWEVCYPQKDFAWYCSLTSLASLTNFPWEDFNNKPLAQSLLLGIPD